MELGSKLADHKHLWSNELRKKFENVTNYISSKISTSQDNSEYFGGGAVFGGTYISVVPPC